MKRRFNETQIKSKKPIILPIKPFQSSSVPSINDEDSSSSNADLCGLDVGSVASFAKCPLRSVTETLLESDTKAIEDSSDPKAERVNLELEKKRKLSSDCASTPESSDLPLSRTPCTAKYQSIPFSSEINPFKRFSSNNFKKIMGNENYPVYSLVTVSSLLEEKELNREKTDLRFLVDTNGQAWFARETHNDFPAPAHYQMTGLPQSQANCRTAGNLFFSSDYKVLKRVNNKSGDFRPSFDSLKWFITILVLNESSLPFVLPEILLADEFSSSGRLERTWKLNISELRSWVMDTFTSGEILDELQKQVQETKTVSYVKEQDSDFQFVTSSNTLFKFDCSGKAESADMPRIKLF
ncbi:hypothetical protein [Legionella maioricensis]|uniref:Uncharacterized protein n=1 Tax=Legionella maioricensis TaxID=2896528 RepID=A0A9X2CZM7_9GAMM|nr:hypothetical protein [Legionella maioricensis]MCL9683624.1 hypothetical protein [Legionella maioricensis]MCL9687646.1 hypothetical protein [Legionella maioricensis]